MKKLIFLLTCTLTLISGIVLAEPAPSLPLSVPRTLPLIWCSLGTSITWYNNHVAPSFSKGYQTRVLEQVKFTEFINRGVNGGCVSSAIGSVVPADLYTIEHGINDWGNRIKPGTLADYTEDTGTGTFAGGYRKLIDKIRATNPKAVIILCTPRKAYGFGNYLPATHDAQKEGGYYLKDYDAIVRAIAAQEKLVIADFYANCGEQDELAALSIDVALHPNDAGYQKMANELVKAILRQFPGAEKLKLIPNAKSSNDDTSKATKYENTLSSVAQVVLYDVDIKQVTVESAMMGGAWIPGGPYAATVHFAKYDPKNKKMTCQIQVRPADNCTRCIGVEFAQEDRDVTAKILWARFAWDDPVGTDFSKPGYSGEAPIAASLQAIGYGISTLTLSTQEN